MKDYCNCSYLVCTKTLDAELEKGRKVEDIIPLDDARESDGMN